MGGPRDDRTATVSLPTGYDDEAAATDRHNLETLRMRSVSRRVKRQLRRRVGDEAALEARLALWELERPRATPSAREALAAAHREALALAEEYRAVCAAIWGADDPDVAANADRIARGDVTPWDARRVIDAERARAQQLQRAAAEVDLDRVAREARTAVTART